MRYADILMNYAECLVETGTNPADAAVYVDKVRERAGLALSLIHIWSVEVQSLYR